MAGSLEMLPEEPVVDTFNTVMFLLSYSTLQILKAVNLKIAALALRQHWIESVVLLWTQMVATPANALCNGG